MMRVDMGKIIVLFVALFAASVGVADNYLVLGVINSNVESESVVLLKNESSDRIMAYRSQQEIEPGLKIIKITHKIVTVKDGEYLMHLPVGSSSGRGTREAVADNSPAMPADYAGGMELKDNVLQVQSSFKRDLLENKLSRIMMEAEATPYMQNGALIGFELTDIQPQSFFEAAGFKDKDVVTRINGQSLNDAASAIRILNALRDSEGADIMFMRGGAEQSLQIVIK